MKFQRCPWEKHATLTITPRRVAAANRRLAKQRDAVALLPDLASKVPTPQADLEAWASALPESHREWRAYRASRWREARRQLAELPESIKRGVQRYWDNWNASQNPAGPENLLSIIHQARRGVSYWTQLRKLRQLQLIGQGRLPRNLFFGSPSEPAWRMRDWRDQDVNHWRRKRARKLGQIRTEVQMLL